MKFANIIMTRKGRITIGDDIQLIAIKNIYEQMGVDYNDVILIPYSKLHDYDGEYVILPISFPVYGYSHDMLITQYSDRIIPVFLGLALLTDVLSSDEVLYLKKYEPIGCRDEYTLHTLRKYNILSYLNGCMTATLPLREPKTDKRYEKIYCIDISDNLKNYIPESIKKECIYLNHVFDTTEFQGNSIDKANEVYSNYKDTAKLVITSRLHAALPCLAMGIPVVLAKDRLSYRFGILKKYINLYSKEEYCNIDWNPKPVYYENTKQKIINNAISRIQEAYNKYKVLYEISEFYEVETKNVNYFEAIDDFKDFILNNFKSDDVFQYSIWGVTQTSEMLYRFISEKYPKASLKAVIDQSRDLTYFGHKTVKKNWLIKNHDCWCFVTAPAAMPEAREFFNEYKHVKHFICWHDNLPR